MKYVIVRDDGAYVAPPGRDKSYTKRLEEARVFESRAAAERDCCGNERIVDVYQLIGGAR